MDFRTPPYSKSYVLLRGNHHFHKITLSENLRKKHNFWLHFGSFFLSFSQLFRHRFPPRFFHRFLMENGSQNGPSRSVADLRFSIIFATFSEGRLFDAFWSPFGSPLAPFWLTFGALWLTFGALGTTFAHPGARFSHFGGLMASFLIFFGFFNGNHM